VRGPDGFAVRTPRDGWGRSGCGDQVEGGFDGVELGNDVADPLVAWVGGGVRGDGAGDEPPELVSFSLTTCRSYASSTARSAPSW
jgi:hypothetical protein